MTVFMSMFGIIVFCISAPFAGFKTAFKRMMFMALAGLCFDILMIVLATVSVIAAN